VRQPEKSVYGFVYPSNAHRPRDEFMISNDREQITFEESQPLATSETPSSFTLSPGNHEFPFEIHLGNAATETVTGPDHEYHSYKVQGIINRRFGNRFVVSRPIRVYKLFDLEANYSWLSSPEVGTRFSLTLLTM